MKQVLGKSFGIDWCTQTYDGVLACSIKRHDAELHAQSLIDAVLELRNIHHVGADDIESIDVDIFKAGYEMIGGGIPESVDGGY